MLHGSGAKDTGKHKNGKAKAKKKKKTTYQEMLKNAGVGAKRVENDNAQKIPDANDMQMSGLGGGAFKKLDKI